MRPLDIWRGKPALASIACLVQLDAYEAEFDRSAALGAQAPLTDVERAAIDRRRAALQDARSESLRAQRDEMRRRAR